jgi:hypothetical protein
LTNNDVSISLTPTGQVSLFAAVSSPATLIAGENLVLSITINNEGPSDATSLVVDVDLDPNTAYLLSTASCSSTSATLLKCTIGTFALTTSEFLVTLTTDPTARRDVTFQTRTATNEPNSNTTYGSTTTFLYGYLDVGISAYDSAPTAHGGDTVTYDVSISDAGPSGMSGVILYVTFAPTVPWTSGLTCINDICSVDDSTTSFQITAHIPKSPEIYNLSLSLDLSVLSIDTDYYLPNNTDSMDVEILGCLPEYYGSNCSFYCDPVVTCHSNGECSDEGLCECDIGWCGPNCDISTTYLLYNASEGASKVYVENSTMFYPNDYILIGVSTNCETLENGGEPAIVFQVNSTVLGLMLTLNSPLRNNHSEGEIVIFPSVGGNQKAAVVPKMALLSLLVLPFGAICAVFILWYP